MKNTMKHKAVERGFTLVELLVVVAILSVVITGMLNLFVFTTVSSEIAGNMTLAVSEAQREMEKIRNYNYDSIATDYAFGGLIGDTFDLAMLTGKGVIYINNSNPELLQIDIVVCWRDKYNRIIGEDLDLDGVLDGGEDSNANGQIDSTVRLASMITRR